MISLALFNPVNITVALFAIFLKLDLRIVVGLICLQSFISAVLVFPGSFDIAFNISVWLSSSIAGAAMLFGIYFIKDLIPKFKSISSELFSEKDDFLKSYFPDREIEDKAYTMAWEELKSGNFDISTMARATAQAMGDKEKAEAVYLKLRVQQIRKDVLSSGHTKIVERNSRCNDVQNQEKS